MYNIEMQNLLQSIVFLLLSVAFNIDFHEAMEILTRN